MAQVPAVTSHRRRIRSGQAYSGDGLGPSARCDDVQVADRARDETQATGVAHELLPVLERTDPFLPPAMGRSELLGLGQNDGVAALLVSEQSHAVSVEQVRLRCLRGAGPFAGVLEMRGIAEREQASVRRARMHRSVAPAWWGTAVALNLID